MKPGSGMKSIKRNKCLLRAGFKGGEKTLGGGKGRWGTYPRRHRNKTPSLSGKTVRLAIRKIARQPDELWGGKKETKSGVAGLGDGERNELNRHSPRSEDKKKRRG